MIEEKEKLQRMWVHEENRNVNKWWGLPGIERRYAGRGKGPQHQP